MADGPGEFEEAMRQHQIEKWIQKRPSGRGWDDPPLSEDAQSHHDAEVKKWVEDMPEQPTGYENERR